MNPTPNIPPITRDHLSRIESAGELSQAILSYGSEAVLQELGVHPNGVKRLQIKEWWALALEMAQAIHNHPVEPVKSRIYYCPWACPVPAQGPQKTAPTTQIDQAIAAFQKARGKRDLQKITAQFSDQIVNLALGAIDPALATRIRRFAKDVGVPLPALSYTPTPRTSSGKRKKRKKKRTASSMAISGL